MTPYGTWKSRVRAQDDVQYNMNYVPHWATMKELLRVCLTNVVHIDVASTPMSVENTRFFAHV